MTDSPAAEYLTKPYHRVVVRNEDGWAARVLEWPGCYGEGETEAEALETLERSMEAWASLMLEDGRAIPNPIGQNYSGRVLLRISHDLHERSALMAAVEGVSLNQFIAGALEARVAGRTSTLTHLPLAMVAGGGAHNVGKGWRYLRGAHSSFIWDREPGDIAYTLAGGPAELMAEVRGERSKEARPSVARR